jgi:hypothetical protein
MTEEEMTKLVECLEYIDRMIKSNPELPLLIVEADYAQLQRIAELVKDVELGEDE